MPSADMQVAEIRRDRRMCPGTSIADAFDRAVDYDAFADVQRSIANGLAARVEKLVNRANLRILEIGCGTGFLGEALVDRLPRAHWLMTDISSTMLDRAHARFASRDNIAYAQIDGQHPNIAGCFDLIVSSLAVQWFSDLPTALGNWRRLLAPAGRIGFTTLVHGNFAEWREAHGSLTPGMQDFVSAEALEEMGLTVSVDKLPVAYGSAENFLRSVKAIGAGTPRPGHRPLTSSQLRTVMARFDAAGGIASYVVATCIGAAVADGATMTEP